MFLKGITHSNVAMCAVSEVVQFAMKFVKSTEMKINLLPEQESQLCTKETIKEIFEKDEKGKCFAYDIYAGDTMIGFAMFCDRTIDDFGYFLWNYAIDAEFQNKGLGTKALEELMDYIISNYDVKKFTTTYSWGNEHAKCLYEKVGFVEMNVIEEDGCKEVDMVYIVDQI